MPDIAMCQNADCSKKDSCYRFQATPHESYQSYADYNGCENGYDCYWSTLTSSHTKTNRGFNINLFKDRYNNECSLQKSSLGTEHAIWLGINDADPKILASKTKAGGVGWVPYDIPDDVLLTTRMHLTQEQVSELIIYLQRFVDTGDIV